VTPALSILDLGDPLDSLRLAPRLDEWGYRRYWLAEHHGAGAKTPSPEILTGLIAGLTRDIRVGPAGILMRYSSPLKVAESFLLLHELFPGRIDLGVARGSGVAANQADLEQALLDGRSSSDSANYYEKLVTLFGFLGLGFPEGHPFARVPVNPRDVAPPEVWVLGGGSESAAFAARHGRAFCAAAHLTAPDPWSALRRYREAFEPSADLSAPRSAISVALSCVDGRKQAADVLARGGPQFVGDVDACDRYLRSVVERAETDEVVVVTSGPISQRLHSFRSLASVMNARSVRPSARTRTAATS
jgi:luciferase family oxidoreductase group 1